MCSGTWAEPVIRLCKNPARKQEKIWWFLHLKRFSDSARIRSVQK